MGGGGSKKTTTNTYTGFGDDQYQSLSNNQSTMIGNQGNIASAVDSVRDEADTAYGNIYNRFGNLDVSQAQIQNLIGNTGNNPTGLYKQFADQNTNLSDQFSSVMSGQNTLSSKIGTEAATLADGQQSISNEMGGRFNSLDTGLGVNLDAIGGVSDQVTGVEDVTDRIDNNTQDLSGDLSTLAVDQAQGFDNATDAMDLGFDAATGDRKTISNTAQEERDTLGTNLGTLGDNQTDYYNDLAGTLGDVQSTADEYVSEFDDYIERYGEDVKAATGERSDILDGAEGQFGLLRDDLGEYTQAVNDYSDEATGDLESEFKVLGDSVEGGFDAISDEVGEGFIETEGFVLNELADLNLEDRFANVIDTLGGDLSKLDGDLMSEFESVMDAFDQQGTLIETEVTEAGDVISRRIDDQGVLVEDRFDDQGTLIGSTETNLNDALTKVEASLGTGLTGVSGDLSNLFDAQNATLSDQGSQLLSLGMAMDGLSDQQRADMQTVSGAFDAQGNLIRTSQDAMGNLVEREMDANGNLISRAFDDQGNLLSETSLNMTDVMSGLSQLDTIQGQIKQGFVGVQDTLTDQTGMMSEMSADQQASFATTQDQILGGFDTSAETMDTQIRDIASVASQMTDLDMGMRQEFYQLGGAFDDNGELIKESVDDNGNLIQRSIDTNGNILLRAFDQTGNAIGQNVINIGKTLGDLAGINTLPGANISMGNLTAPLQANPDASQPNVPVSGFMAPYTETA